MSVLCYKTGRAGKLGKLSSQMSGLAGIILLLSIAVLDWVTGPQVALSVFYLIPIVLVTCGVSRWAGLGMAVLGGATWMAVDLLTNKAYTNFLLPFWNAIVRTVFFCLVSGLVAEVMERKRAEKSLRESQALLEQRARNLAQSESALQQHTSILQSILDCMGDGVVVTRSSSELVLMNPAARRMLQIPDNTPDSLARLGFLKDNLGSGANQDWNRQDVFRRAVRGEAVDGSEVFLPNENHRAGIWILVTGRPLLDATGQMTGAVVVLNDITARKDVERRIAEVCDREQRRIGEDLHDGLCQQLVGAAFAARKLAARLSDLLLKESEEAARIAELLGDSISQARDVARGLYLVQLDTDGLTAALEELATQVRSNGAMGCQFINQSAVAIVDEAAATNLFRIAQEAVNNAVKHSRASQVTIALAADDQRILLTVADNGGGIPSEYQTAGGMGVKIMRYRAHAIGATLEISPCPGGGTIVACLVGQPIPVGLATHS